jgi:predicted porin
MNLKKTAVASAVGATLAISGVASSVAYADGHEVKLYGRINNAYVMNEEDGTGFDEDSTNISTVGSRLGVKASAPVGDGLTAHGHYEWATSTDDETGAFGDTRLGYVGLSGDFGRVDVGNQWSTFYNIVGTHLDPTVTVGAVLYSTIADFPYRVSNAIKYTNSFGAVNLSAEIRLSDEDHPDEGGGKGDAEKIGAADGHAVGVSFNVTDNLLLAAAIDSSNDEDLGADADRDRVGFAAKWSAGNWWVSAGFAEHEADDVVEITQTQFHAGMDFGDGLNGWVGFGEVEVDPEGGSKEDADAVTLNLTKRLGGGFRVYYEGFLGGTEDVLGYDRDWHLFGMRLDF